MIARSMMPRPSPTGSPSLSGGNSPPVLPYRDRRREAAEGPALSADMRLSEFFQRWYLPIVLQSQRGYDSDCETVRLYREAIRWWIALTRDPPIRLIDDFAIARFRKLLGRVWYRRGGRGSVPRRLAKNTQNKHLRRLRSVYYRVGPTYHPNRPGKRLVEEVACITISPAQGKQRRTPTIEQIERIAAAAEKIDWPVFRQRRDGSQAPPPPPKEARRPLVLCFFYTGLRVGEILSLRWEMLERRAAGQILNVPSEAVAKTGKAQEKSLHPSLAAALADMPGEHSGLIFHWPANVKVLDAWLKKVQLEAGVPAEGLFGFHGWRRAHAREAGRAGALAARDAAQRSLNHSDSRVTREHYYDPAADADVMRGLPLLASPRS